LEPSPAWRATRTRLFAGRLAPQGKHALKIFWEKRKREAGKLGADPMVKLKERRFGKAQFNWSPTRDLQSGRLIGLLVWGALIVTALAVTATFAFQEAYSPGPLSTSHSRGDFSMTSPIAKEV